MKEVTKQTRLILGAKIATIRMNLGLSQNQFSKALDIRRATLSEYENGLRLPSLTFIYAVVSTFKVKLEYFNPSYRRNAVIFDNDVYNSVIEIPVPKSPLKKGDGPDLVIARVPSRAAIKAIDDEITKKAGISPSNIGSAYNKNRFRYDPERYADLGTNIEVLIRHIVQDELKKERESSEYSVVTGKKSIVNPPESIIRQDSQEEKKGKYSYDLKSEAPVENTVDEPEDKRKEEETEDLENNIEDDENQIEDESEEDDGDGDIEENDGDEDEDDEDEDDEDDEHVPEQRIDKFQDPNFIARLSVGVDADMRLGELAEQKQIEENDSKSG